MSPRDLLRAARAGIAAFRLVLAGAPLGDPAGIREYLKQGIRRRSAATLVDADGRLFAEQVPVPKPARTRTLSPRVLELLREIGVSPDRFRDLGRRDRRGLAARRSVVAKLRSEGLSVSAIAAACCLSNSTVYRFLEAKPAKVSP